MRDEDALSQAIYIRYELPPPAVYNSLVRLDRTTNTWTYFPYPMERQHTPKMELDSQGTIWFGISGQLTAFKPNGNIPKRLLSTR